MATVGEYGAVYCYEIDANNSGTTVSPVVGAWACPIIPNTSCSFGPPTEVDKTGFVPNHSVSVPEYRLKPSFGTRWHGGTVGWAYVDGKSYAVNVPGYCYGDPSYCAGYAIII